MGLQDPVRRAAAVEVDLVVAGGLAEFRAAGEGIGVGATQLQPVGDNQKASFASSLRVLTKSLRPLPFGKEEVAGGQGAGRLAAQGETGRSGQAQHLAAAEIGGECEGRHSVSVPTPGDRETTCRVPGGGLRVTAA